MTWIVSRSVASSPAASGSGSAASSAPGTKLRSRSTKHSARRAKFIGCVLRGTKFKDSATVASAALFVCMRYHPVIQFGTVSGRKMRKLLERQDIRGFLLTAAFTPVLAFAAPHAYVANQNDGTVSVIDTQSDEVVRTLDLHAKTDGKLQAAIADRAEKTLFVVDAAGSKLIVVDLAGGEIRTRIAAGQSPEGASISPNGKQIAVCGEDDNLVTMIDVATQ